MAENDDYGLPDVDYDPIDRGAKGTQTRTKSSTSKKERKKDNKAPIIIVLVIVLLAVVGGLYFFVIKPNQAAAEAKELAEAKAAEEAAEAERLAQARADSIRFAEEEAAAQVAAEEAANADPEPGTITILENKTGKSYVVIGSFFDEDMAGDASNNLADQGVSSYILKPVGDVKFYRLAVADFDSFGDAMAAVEEYKQTYGEEIWALKY